MMSGMSQEGVRWCQKVQYVFMNVSDGVKKVSNDVKKLKGRCHIVSGRSQEDARW